MQKKVIFILNKNPEAQSPSWRKTQFYFLKVPSELQISTTINLSKLN